MKRIKENEYFDILCHIAFTQVNIGMTTIGGMTMI